MKNLQGDKTIEGIRILSLTCKSLAQLQFCSQSSSKGSTLNKSKEELFIQKVLVDIFKAKLQK